jgi:DNA modification methylase
VKPYYEADGITIYHGDCREIAPSLAYDAVVSDPPYGLGDLMHRPGDGQWSKLWGDGAPSWDRAAPQWIGSLVVGIPSIIWGGNYFALPLARGWLVWDKVVREFSSGHCELAWTNIDQPVRAFSYSHGQLANEGKLHPTQKPVGLMAWCLRFLPDALCVLDPFAGSGSTLRAAKDLGRKAIGIEIEERYCEIAAKRLAQGVLFEAPEPAKPAEQMALDVSPLTPPSPTR